MNSCRLRVQLPEEQPRHRRRGPRRSNTSASTGADSVGRPGRRAKHGWGADVQKNNPGTGAGGPCAATPAHLPAPTLSDDQEDGPSMVGGQTSKDNDRLGHTRSHIACLDALDAEDELGLVEEGARSPSLILNSLHLNLQSATLTALYEASFQRWVKTP